MRESVATVQQTMTNLQEEIETSSRSIAEVRGGLISLQSNVTSLSTEIIESSRQVVRIQSGLSTVQTNVTVLGEEIRESINEIGELQSNLLVVQTNMTRLSGDIDKSVVEVNAVRGSMTTTLDGFKMIIGVTPARFVVIYPARCYWTNGNVHTYDESRYMAPLDMSQQLTLRTTGECVYPFSMNKLIISVGCINTFPGYVPALWLSCDLTTLMASKCATAGDEALSDRTLPAYECTGHEPYKLSINKCTRETQALLDGMFLQLVSDMSDCA
eukprot:c6327_g1_i3.p1 GENE.c6327_g1_i3~~c6327_g1_i3.p1  ORF type:complete len:271 (-),score=54.07 c6327_g1_i3:41-853(-)